ncbi:MAG: UV DNA damage repair endonuclease UvsE [Candidatus Cloacimonetes bacterium]|nr:UV DNA damage repair endonuclease UvsE [Candidatus Cloacimonadota bacterium]
MIRLGLCCIFKEEPIKFHVTTAKRLNSYEQQEHLRILGELCLHNAKTLKIALQYCANNGIGDFRILSQINPLRTHPDVGYKLHDLPQVDEILKYYRECRNFNKKKNIRTSFHPDQFIVLSTPHPNVLQSSLAELAYQAEIAEFIGADVINVHGGGVYGKKKETLGRLSKEIEKLPEKLLTRLTLENDDRSYTPEDLIPVCKALAIPLVYDVHHHRCLPDKLSVEKATDLAIQTWNREPLFHLSSPRDGWNKPNPQFHHDFIDINDFPDYWKTLDLTIEIEAKSKEVAIKKLRAELIAQGVQLR